GKDGLAGALLEGSAQHLGGEVLVALGDGFDSADAGRWFDLSAVVVGGGRLAVDEGDDDVDVVWRVDEVAGEGVETVAVSLGQCAGDLRHALFSLCVVVLVVCSNSCCARLRPGPSGAWSR